MGKNVHDYYFMKSLGLRKYQSNCDNRQGIAKPYTIVILWTHSPVASKLGALHLKQSKPRASHFVS